MLRFVYRSDTIIGRASRPYESHAKAMVWWGLLAAALITGLIVYEVLDASGITTR